MDCDEIFVLSSRKSFWAADGQREAASTHQQTRVHTLGEVIVNYEVGLGRGNGHVEGRHGEALRLARRARAIVGRHGVLAGEGLERRRGRGRGSRWGLEHGGHVAGAKPSQFERHVSGLRPEGAIWAPSACDGVSVLRGASRIAGTRRTGTGAGLGRRVGNQSSGRDGQ